MVDRIRVFFETQELDNGDAQLREVELSSRDSHHLKHVLRVSPGALVTAVNRSSGREYEAFVATLHPVVTVKFVSVKSGKVTMGRVASLSFALMKGGHNDLVVEKASEFGVRHLVAWQAGRSVARLSDAKSIHAKQTRWQRIAESAAKQSGKNFVPCIHFIPEGVGGVLELLGRVGSEADAFLCCSLSPRAKELRFLAPPYGQAHVVVGPEGDFSPQEEAALDEKGFQFISLGPFILRAETAAIGAVAMVQGVWGNAE